MKEDTKYTSAKVDTKYRMVDKKARPKPTPLLKDVGEVLKRNL